MQKLKKQILDILFTHKRSAQEQSCGVGCEFCYLPHESKLSHALANQQKIQLILPAFPAKSANREKTLSASPDLGEVLSLQRLNALCKEIHAIYSPGVELIICSDGRVFNDLVLVSDEEVVHYQQEIEKIIQQYHLDYLKLFSLDDIYQGMSYDEMRQNLTTNYGEALSLLKSKILSSSQLKVQFNGIHRFLVEDQTALMRDISKNQVRKRAKTNSYQVVLRSNAWSRLLEVYFPHAVRLSIHPQLCGSEKLGIHFIPTKNQWGTPWHNVLLKKKTGWVLVKRKEAEAMGAVLNKDHYVFDAVEEG